MNENLADLQTALEEARKTRKELDRKLFHLKALYDLTSELSPITQTEKLLDTFLLMSMGTFGISRGFVLLYNREEKTVRTADRGLSQKGELSAEAAEKLFFKCFDAAHDKSLAPMSVARLTAPELFAEAGLVSDAEIGLMFVVDPSLMGLIGLGPTLSGDSLSQEETELLFAQVSNFMVFLKTARSFETIRNLNEDLNRRNEELRQTIRELTEARDTITVLERAKARLKSLARREMERTGRVSLLDFALILVAAVVVGVLFNFSSPNGVPLLPPLLFQPSPPSITVAEAGKLLDENGAVLVDARPQEFYLEKHIRGALNLPPALFDIIYMMKLSDLDPEETIIVYGRNISKRYDEEVAHLLTKRDHENVRILSGGLSAWEEQGYAVEP